MSEYKELLASLIRKGFFIGMPQISSIVIVFKNENSKNVPDWLFLGRESM